MSRFRRFDRPDRKAQSGSRENGRQAAQFRVAGLGEHAVHRLPRELGATGHGGDPPVRHRDLPKRERERALMTFVDHGFEIGGRLLRVLQLLDEPILEGKARLGRVPPPASCAA